MLPAIDALVSVGAVAGKAVFDKSLPAVTDMPFLWVMFAAIADEFRMAADIELFKEVVPAIFDCVGNPEFNVDAWAILTVSAMFCTAGNEDAIAWLIWAAVANRL